MKSIKGLTLVEVIIAMTISVMGSYFLVSLLNVLMKGQKSTEMRLDSALLKAALDRAMSCDQTLAGITSLSDCDGQYIVVKDGRGNPLIADVGSSFGEWFVRAKCTTTGLDIRAASPRNPASNNFDTSINPKEFRQDPLTKTVLDWNSHRAKLYPATFRPCASPSSGGNGIYILRGMANFAVGSTDVELTGGISHHGSDPGMPPGPKLIGSISYVPKGNFLRVNVSSALRVLGQNAVGILKMDAARDVASGKSILSPTQIYYSWGVGDHNSTMTYVTDSVFLNDGVERGKAILFSFQMVAWHQADVSTAHGGWNNDYEIHFHGLYPIKITIEDYEYSN